MTPSSLISALPFTNTVASSAEWFGPKDALNRSSLVFQTEYRKSIALLCCAQLKVRNQAGNRCPRAAFLLTQFNRGYRAEFGDQFKMSLQGMPGNIKAYGLFFRGQHF